MDVKAPGLLHAWVGENCARRLACL